MRNKADADLRHTEKGLADAGDKLSPEQREDVASTAASLRTAIAGNDLAALQRAIDTFGQATNPLATIIMNEVVRKRFGGTDEGSARPKQTLTFHCINCSSTQGILLVSLTPKRWWG